MTSGTSAEVGVAYWVVRIVPMLTNVSGSTQGASETPANAQRRGDGRMGMHNSTDVGPVAIGLQMGAQFARRLETVVRRHRLRRQAPLQICHHQVLRPGSALGDAAGRGDQIFVAPAHGNIAVGGRDEVLLIEQLAHQDNFLAQALLYLSIRFCHVNSLALLLGAMLCPVRKGPPRAPGR